MEPMEPYLFFDGNCAEAMRFYERTLGGKLEAMLTHAESPAAAQSPPGNANGGMKGFFLSLVYGTVDEAKRVFDTLANGGKVNMPMDKTFWVESFGMVVDRFGTPWMVSGGKQNK